MGNIQDTLMRQFQSMDQAYEKYAKANGLNYLSLMVLTEAGNTFCRQVICPLLEQEEAVAGAMGVRESRELERLLELYGTAYCEKLRALAISRTR